jgi:Cytochrome c/c1 heme lyase
MGDYFNTRLGFDRDEKLQLVRFKGRPGELSPKARFWLFAGWLLPDRFKYVPVLRPRPSVIGTNTVSLNQ